MNDNLRDSGIDIIGKVPWGTHFCQFYQSQKDLTETLIPYFKAGLENNEFCMWVTSEPLTVASARLAMSKVIPKFKAYLKKGQCEIVPYTEWYLKDGYFDMNRVVEGWIEKIESALRAGYAGIRVTGNTAWLEKKDWSSFAEYEASLNRLGPHNILALCTYSLDKCSALEIMEVMANHEFALIKQEGRWGVIQNTIGLREKKELSSKLLEHATILENMNDAVIEYDAGYRIVYWNRAAEKIYGYLAAEAIGKMGDVLLQPEYQNQKRTELVQKILTEGHIEIESRRTAKDDKKVDVESHIMMHKDENGKPTGYVAVDRDITEHKRVEEALRETRDYLDNLFNYANAPIIVWSPDLLITRFNHAFERLTGHKVDEVIGKSIDILFPADKKQIAMDYIRRTTSGIERWETEEIPILRTDGTVRTVLWNSANLYSTDGKSIVATIAQGQDITERKQAEESLRQTKDYLDNLFNYANAPIIVWDPDLKITRFNHAFERLTGRNAEEVIGGSLDILFPADSRESSLHYIRRATSGAERWETVDIPIQRTDGTVRTVLWNSANLYDEENKSVIATIAQGQDITERKQAEESLRQTKDYLDNLFNYANAPIIVWDPDLKITRFNHAFERLTGRKADDVIGRSIDILFPEDKRENSIEYIRKTTTSGERWEIIEIPILHIGGSVRTVLWNSANIYDTDGKTIISIIAQGQDITERKEAEDKVQAQLDLLQLAQIFVQDMDNRIIFWNEGSRRLYGYSVEEAIDKVSHDLLQTVFPEPLENIKNTLLQTGKWEGELVHTKRDGTRITSASYWVLHHGLNNEPEAIIETNTDITRAKQAELELKRRSQELEVANKELEAFSYSVSHDLRAPLRSMEGFSDALLTDYADKLDEQARQYLGWIQESSTLMAQLIDDLLKLSRVTRSEMNFEEVNLSEMARKTAAELKKTDSKRKADFIIVPDMKVYGDYNLLKVVLQNLLGNAWKFTGRTEPAKIEVGVTRIDDNTVYFVRDNGAGFDMSYAGKLFLPFQRLHTTEDFPGTGIGLATVQRIISRHGGKVWAEGKINEGAIFYFTLEK